MMYDILLDFLRTFASTSYRQTSPRREQHNSVFAEVIKAIPILELAQLSRFQGVESVAVLVEKVEEVRFQLLFLEPI